MYYQIILKQKGGTWILDKTKYSDWYEAHENACIEKEYNKTIERIEVICGEED